MKQQPQAARGDLGLKSNAADLIRLSQMLLSGGIVPPSAKGESDTGAPVRVLSAEAVQQMSQSSLPAECGLHSPFALGAKGEEVEHSFFGLDVKEFKHHRVANSYPGQGFGLGVAIVEDAARSGLHPKAKGTCWWQGVASTFFAFNPTTKIGVLVLSQTLFCVATQEALADAVNAAHAHMFDKGNKGSENGPVLVEPKAI